MEHEHGRRVAAASRPQLGRDLRDDDVEPVNRAQVEFARNVSAVDYALALAANVEFRRAVQQWWADGWDLLLTPTLGRAAGRDRDRSPTTTAARWRRWRGPAAFVPFTPAFNASGQPAINLPLHWNDAGLPIGVQLVAAYGREDVLAQGGGAARGGPAVGRIATRRLTAPPAPADFRGQALSIPVV